MTPLKYLPLCAGLAASAGLPMEEAWKAITINPATQIGIADRVGSLEPGKDADIVIMDDAFQVRAVYVRGELRHEAD